MDVTKNELIEGGGQDAKTTRGAGCAGTLSVLEAARMENGWMVQGWKWAPASEASELRGGGGDPEGGESPLRFLGCRVDAFYLAFQGFVAPAVQEVLTRRLADAQKLCTSVAVELGQFRGALSARSREGWWLLENGDVIVRLEEGAPERWALSVQPSALYLAVRGPRAALELGRAIARELLALVQGERLRRLDLCADFTRFDLRGIDPRGLLAHRRTSAQSIATLKQYLRAGKRTGLVVGKSDVSARIYDKTEELLLCRNDGEKRTEEHTRWRMAGWNGAEDVTRVEFQLRGDVMKELDIRDPEKALARVDAVWSYCTRKWLRLVVPNTAKRRDRSDTDPRWFGVRAVVFREAVKVPPKRERSPGRARARPAASAAINYGAQAGVLRPNGVKDASKHVAGWSESYSEGYVQMTLDFAMRAAGRAAGVELIAMLGAKGAAAHVMEKVNAGCARFTAFEKLGEVAIAA